MSSSTKPQKTYPSFAEFKRRASRTAAAKICDRIGPKPSDAEIRAWSQMIAEQESLGPTDLESAVRDELKYRRDKIRERQALANAIVSDREREALTAEGRRRQIIRKVEAENRERDRRLGLNGGRVR